MNTKIFLILGTSLSFLPQLTFAQCVATQDCQTLGYTETSCNGGKGVKCPFGNWWACLTSEEECLNLACDKLGFAYTCTGNGEKGVGNDCNGKYQGCTCDSSYQYTCTGTGYSDGVGAACNGKYTSCTCASNYEWKDGSCQPQLTGAQGNLYYCNGNVVGVKSSDMDFYIAMNDLGFMNFPNAKNAVSNYIFCNTLKGTMPSSAQLQIIYKNKSFINDILAQNGATVLNNDAYWSSTPFYPNNTSLGNYVVNMSDGVASYYMEYSGYNGFYVRPILTSYQAYLTVYRG